LSSPCCISILEKIFNFAVTQYLGSLGEEHKRPDVTTRGLLDTWSRNLEGEFVNEPLIEVAVHHRLESRRRVLPDEHPDTVESWHNLIELYEAWGKPEKAEEWRAKLPLGKDIRE